MYFQNNTKSSLYAHYLFSICRNVLSFLSVTDRSLKISLTWYKVMNSLPHILFVRVWSKKTLYNCSIYCRLAQSALSTMFLARNMICVKLIVSNDRLKTHKIVSLDQKFPALVTLFLAHFRKRDVFFYFVRTYFHSLQKSYSFCSASREF